MLKNNLEIYLTYVLKKKTHLVYIYICITCKTNYSTILVLKRHFPKYFFFFSYINVAGPDLLFSYFVKIPSSARVWYFIKSMFCIISMSTSVGAGEKWSVNSTQREGSTIESKATTSAKIWSKATTSAKLI